MDKLTDGVTSAALADLVGELSSYLGDVSAGLLGKLTDADVLAELREFEALRRRLAVIDHALVAELGRRALPGRLVLGSTSALLQAALRLSPHEARQRVAASQVCGPRWGLTGEQLGTLLPDVAAAQAAGVVSAEHARVIASTLEELPSSVDAADVAAAEQQLVRAAAQLRPRQVGVVGQRILAHLNPDGVLASDEEHVRRRSFALIPEANGGYRAAGRLTPACGALLLSWLTPRSAPRPAAGQGDQAGEAQQASALVADSRSHGQRMHDALQDLAGLAVRRTELVDSGAPAHVIISMTAEQLDSRDGWAETSFGQLLPVDEALRLADEAAISLLLRDARGAVLCHGRTKRIATRAQTLALIARDGGCSFRGVTSRRSGANATTSQPGPTAAPPIWTTSPWSADTTTASSNAPAGPASSRTGFQSGSRPPGSTPPEHPDATTASPGNELSDVTDLDGQAGSRMRLGGSPHSLRWWL